MGIDQWRFEQDWPLPDTSYEPWYLDGAGRANSSAGDGLLSPQPPAGQATDTYLYYPLRPVPSLGGRVMLPTQANAAGAVAVNRVLHGPAYPSRLVLPVIRR